jgi:two-component system response regulator NreC
MFFRACAASQNFLANKEGTVCPHAQIQPDVSGVRKIRCMVVHDHTLLRQGLRRLLEDEPDLAVVAEAGHAAEALQKACDHSPDVVITDARVFSLAADQVEHLILHESPESKVLFLTMQDDDYSLPESADEASCAVRRTSAAELVGMVRRVFSGEHGTVREMPRRWHGADDEPIPRKRVLTAREREVVKLLAEGRTVRSVASVLGVSAKTVDAHKFNLMRKLGIHNKAELVMWAVQKRVVKLPVNS